MKFAGKIRVRKRKRKRKRERERERERESEVREEYVLKAIYRAEAVVLIKKQSAPWSGPWSVLECHCDKY